MTTPNSRPQPVSVTNPDLVHKTVEEHQAQAKSSTWEFVSPARKKAAQDAAAAPEGSDEEPPAHSGVFEGLPPPAVPSVLKEAAQYPAPHPFMRWFRGIPMKELQDRENPPLNIPAEAAHMAAIHLERCGLMHEDELRALANEHGWIHVNQLRTRVIKHRKPEHGADTFRSPGTWHDINEPDPDRRDSNMTFSTTPALEVPDLSGLHPARLAALEEAVKREKIRQLQIQHADPHAQASAVLNDLKREVVVQVTDCEGVLPSAEDLIPKPQTPPLHTVLNDRMALLKRAEERANDNLPQNRNDSDDDDLTLAAKRRMADFQLLRERMRAAPDAAATTFDPSGLTEGGNL
jgi:Protein of unknown function (DUF2744)